MPLSAVRVALSSVETYEIDLWLPVEGEEGGASARLLRCRCDTWKSLHEWLNGLSLLAGVARAHATGDTARDAGADLEGGLLPMGQWARDQVAAAAAGRAIF